jgi:hypothetical protein
LGVEGLREWRRIVRELGTITVVLNVMAPGFQCGSEKADKTKFC